MIKEKIVEAYEELTEKYSELIDHKPHYIDKLIEPRPTPEFEKYDARHYRELNESPSFMCMRAIKHN